MKRIILASKSPRRRELLEMTGLKFDIVVSSESEDNVDATLPPDIYTNELAVLKATSVAKKLLDDGAKDMIIISADTIVYSDGEILGKPKDKEDAKRILKKLSGKTHNVYTGICVLRTKDGFLVSKSVKTDVKFKDLTDNVIEGYIKTGEPMDKAGAYGIQGLGSLLIEKINGDYFNVVGLPLSELCDVLCDEFEISIF